MVKNILFIVGVVLLALLFGCLVLNVAAACWFGHWDNAFVSVLAMLGVSKLFDGLGDLA